MERAQSRAGSSADSNARVGKYQILTRLAVGGMAEIFLAVVSGPGGFRKFVTLKRILPDLRREEEFVKMFLDEARISASLSHANIAQVFDLGMEGDDLYIAMEFVAGRDLGEIVRECKRRNRPVPLGFAAMVARNVCLALHYAHNFSIAGRTSPVIHRDISPNNLMVTYDGSVKVIDFGVAKAKGSLGKTGDGTVKGSSGYMSPEQVRGGTVDCRSDLFSLGVVLHELLTGQPLFRRRTDLLTIRAILREEIKDPRKANPGVPTSLSNVVMRALGRDPLLRYPSGREMAKAIEEAVPALLFDEGQTSEFLCELFEERMNQTRTLFEFASPDADDASLREAAAFLRDQAAARQQQSEDQPTGEVATYRTAVLHLEGSGPAAPLPVHEEVKPLVTGVMQLGAHQVKEPFRDVRRVERPAETKPSPPAEPPPAETNGGSPLLLTQVRGTQTDAPVPLTQRRAGPPGTEPKSKDAPARPTPAAIPRPTRPEMILVVDDSEISRRFIEAHVQDAGYEVHCCASAEDALGDMEHRTPDLVLLDLLMPGTDGFALCQQIRERPQWRTLPILFLSSACSLEERLRGLTVGGDDFLRKPYDPAELTARIHAHLQRVAFLRQVGQPN